MCIRDSAQIALGSNVNTVPQLFAMKSFSIGGLHIKNFFGLAMDLTLSLIHISTPLATSQQQMSLTD